MTQTNTIQNKEELTTSPSYYKEPEGITIERIVDDFIKSDNQRIFRNQCVRDLKEIVSQAHQSGIEEERKRIIKVIESFIDPNPVFLEEHREKIFLKEVIKSLKENK